MTHPHGLIPLAYRTGNGTKVVAASQLKRPFTMVESESITHARENDYLVSDGVKHCFLIPEAFALLLSRSTVDDWAVANYLDAANLE